MPPLSIGPSMNGLVAYASSIDREQTRRESASGHSADSLPNSGTLPLPGADGEHSPQRRPEDDVQPRRSWPYAFLMRAQ